MTHRRTDPPVNKLLVALFASTFVFGSVSVLAAGSSMKSSTSLNTTEMDIDVQPLSTLDTNRTQAARAKAKDHWAKMTPEEQAAATKAARAKQQGELTALDELAKQGFWARWLGLPWRIPPTPPLTPQRQ